MALKHDAQGFLAGDAIDIGRAISIWDEIRKDVRAIRHAVTGTSTPGNDYREKSNTSSVQPLGRDSQGRFIKAAVGMEEADLKKSSPARANGPVSISSTHVYPEPKKAANPVGRDGGGRFVKGEGGVKPGANGDGTPGESTLRNFADRIAGAVSGAAGGMEEADPAVKAFQEIAQPLARGYQMITGGRDEKRKEGWFRKIYVSLSGFRKDETVFNKAANKSLKNLEDKPDGGDGQAGFWGKILASILGIGPWLMAAMAGMLAKTTGFLKTIFKGGGAATIGASGAASTAKGAAGAAAKGVATEAGAAAKGVASGAGEAAKGGLKGFAGKALKKIPILGTLLALGMGASEAKDIESDDKTTRQEKTAKHGRNVGEVAGGLGGAAAGAAIGTLIFPGVGTVIGGVIGAVAGDWLGGNAGEIIGENFKGITESMASGWKATTETASAAWAGVTAGFMVVSDAMGINWKAIGSGISSAWDSVALQFTSISAGVGKSWGEFVALAKSGWDAFTGLFSAAYEGLKKIPIIGAGIQAAEDAAKATATAAKAVADKAVTATKEAAVKAATAVKDKAVDVVDKTVAVAKDAGAAAKTAYVEKTNPGTGAAGPAPVGVVNRAAATVGRAAGSVTNGGRSLAAMIAGGESGKEGYDAYNRGTGLGSTGHRDVSGMTLDEISKNQKLDKSDNNRLMAVGKYQMMPSTLAEGAKSLGLSGDTKYDAGTQEKLYSEYLLGKKRPQIKDYITGKSTDSQAAQIAMAQEWRSIADPRTGQTYSDKGATGNKASITADQSKAAMDQSAAKYKQNLASGMGEKEAYQNAVSSMQTTTAQATPPAPGIKVASKPASTVIAATPAAPTTAAQTKAASPAEAPAPPAEVKVASLRDDPTQGGRLSYKDIGDNQFSVSDNVTGVTELASEEQANAQRRSQTKAYRDSLASANDPNTYKTAGANATASVAASPAIQSPAPPAAIAAPVQTAYVAAPKAPTFAPPPVISEAPPVINPLASSADSKKQMTVSVAAQDAGQDLKDRRIAHIVTGGFSA